MPELATLEALINYLLQIDLIKSKVKEIELKKEGYFSEAGKIAREVAFITEGILRVCYYHNKGEEITRYFINENNFIVDLESFTNKIPSPIRVIALTFAILNWTVLPRRPLQRSSPAQRMTASSSEEASENRRKILRCVSASYIRFAYMRPTLP